MKVGPAKHWDEDHSW